MVFLRKFNKAFKKLITLGEKLIGAENENPPLLSDISSTERIIEYGWVLKNLSLEKGKILDFGCEGTLFPIMLAILGYEVVGVDIKDYNYKHKNFRFIKCNILEPDNQILEQKFDIITCISSLEHVGFSEKIIDFEGDIKAIKILASILKSRGFLFLTFGFGGKFQVHHLPSNPDKPFGRLYDEQRLKYLLNNQFKEIKIEYFIKNGGSWHVSDKKQIETFIYPKSWIETKSIVCIKLEKI
ncbi:MAG: methyltransferase domain-containing protein [Candidatus Thermoplasmatota archaeon]